MYEWIIRYEDEKALEEVLKTGELVFESNIINMVIMNSYLNQETIMKIQGVIGCEEARMGELYTVNGE